MSEQDQPGTSPPNGEDHEKIAEDASSLTRPADGEERAAKRIKVNDDGVPGEGLHDAPEPSNGNGAESKAEDDGRVPGQAPIKKE